MLTRHTIAIILCSLTGWIEIIYLNNPTKNSNKRGMVMSNNPEIMDFVTEACSDERYEAVLVAIASGSYCGPEYEYFSLKQDMTARSMNVVNPLYNKPYKEIIANFGLAAVMKAAMKSWVISMQQACREILKKGGSSEELAQMLSQWSPNDKRKRIGTKSIDNMSKEELEAYKRKLEAKLASMA